jgi:hypothetical protein
MVMHLSEGCDKWMFYPRKCSQATHGMDDTILGEFSSTYSCPFNNSAKEAAQVAQEKDCNNHLLPKIKMISLDHFDLRKEGLGPRWLSKYIFQSKILDLFLTIASHFYI